MFHTVLAREGDPALLLGRLSGILISQQVSWVPARASLGRGQLEASLHHGILGRDCFPFGLLFVVCP